MGSKGHQPLRSPGGAERVISPPRAFPVDLVWTEARWRAFFGNAPHEPADLHKSRTWRLPSLGTPPQQEPLSLDEMLE